MKVLKALAPALIAIVFYSCNSSDGKTINRLTGSSRLKIAIDTGSNFYIDTLSLSASYKPEGAGIQHWDSTFNQLVYVFDSVENGKLDITLVSFLDRIATKTILLSGDTSIFISKNELNNFNNIKSTSIPSLELENGDSVIIGLWSMGCFQFLKENVIIRKENENYLVSFNTTRPRNHLNGNLNLKKKFDSSFQIQLENFYKSCEKLKALSKKGFAIFSTTSAYVYIRKGNEVFRLPEIGGLNWEGYDDLVKAIDPPWPNIKEIEK